MRVISLFFVLSLSLFVDADSHTASDGSGSGPGDSAGNDGIIPNEEGWWGTGILVGTVPERGWQNGFVWESGSFTLLAGGGYGQGYPPEPFKLTVEAEYKETLWNQVPVTGKPVGIQYIYPFFRNAFKNPNFYFMANVVELYDNFYQSPSYNRSPEGISIAPYHNNGVIFRHRESVGLPVHVSRWGQTLVSQRCTVYLHIGGQTSISVDEQLWADDWSYDPDKGIWVKKSVIYSHKGSTVVPNIIQVDTFDEYICRYAEDATRARTQLKIAYSGLEPAPQETGSSLANPVIHEIVIAPE